ncbi:MAG TPA: glycoside hydrolase family 2 TIM barrel-domain containing protein [Gaiellaceae bacterium]|nr:glycoside hydrolase family 2 TIM barrel-domain containing protein [Gaiellaceae bacterium]
MPGLWEAQGHLELDGVGWYRRAFRLADADGFWSLRFGAVMDVADVYLNGRHLGTSELAFTPFEVDPTDVLRAGENELAVRVLDPGLDHPEHVRLPHGKQGWANHIFPSRPSLYLTYGGIWQPVTLRRHGPVVVSDAFVNGDPDDLRVTVEVENRAGAAWSACVGIRTLGLVHEERVELEPGARRTVEARLGATSAARWSPASPMLQHALVDVVPDGAPADTCSVRYGLRTVRLHGHRMVVCGEPYRMKSALVQGFRSDTLYAEGTREQIREEVLAAKAMGFNTLRLHIKAFDPTYLDVCDEEGMLLHCDIPNAEPLAYEEMGDGGVVSQRFAAAARAQVRRDRNHPSVILWSAMNEIGVERAEIRLWPEYEQLARTVHDAVLAEDPTRPVIENDWVEPDPARVFRSPILTAHWYGRLHARYLRRLDEKTARWAAVERPFFVSEYGDWGLPAMPELDEEPFWGTRAVVAADLARSLWPGTLGRFVVETQRYQGLADRLQTEVFRRYDGVDGYCLTELTDVPRELNGLLDLDRAPKPLAVAEMTRANQVVLPMLRLDSLVLRTGASGVAPLHVANDGPELPDVGVSLHFGHGARPTADVGTDVLAGYTVTALGDLPFETPSVPGSHDLVVELFSAERLVAENRYPVHVVAAPAACGPVRLLGGGATLDALRALGADVGEAGPLVAAEGALDEAAGRELARRLDAGETVLVLAQPAEAALHYPGQVELVEVGTLWGSSVFHFTTDRSPLASLPRRSVLAAEDSTIQAHSIATGFRGVPFPTDPVVIAYKPEPRPATGTVVGATAVGAGTLIVCQYRLAEPAVAGDAAASALLADLVGWAQRPAPRYVRETSAAGDGRELHRYTFGGA